MDVIGTKLSRLRNGETPKLVDLFSGAGGISLGFHFHGAESVLGVEADKHAARSFAENLQRADSRKRDADQFKWLAAPKDITQLVPDQVMKDAGHPDPRLAVDIVVGGPPCPPFARIGRAKLREIAQHPDAFLRDPRARLYEDFLRFVDALQPVAVVMENVPDFLNHGAINMGEVITDHLSDYECRYTILNAAAYGVPQYRERFFLVAIHRAAEIVPSFPVPSRRISPPAGYRSAQSVALRLLRGSDVLPATRFVRPPSADEGAPGPVTVRQAIGDLPAITSHLDGTLPRGARRFNSPVAYRPIRPSDYARSLRNWSGFPSSRAVSDHVIRSLSARDFPIFRRMQQGDQYPQAWDIANDIFEEALISMGEAAPDPALDPDRYEDLRRKHVPPYDPSKFPNKWWKLRESEPARTLMAHLGKDTYSHIHFDDIQQRTISVREAARLQSFPDAFRFAGTMNPAFKQIGNSVPPLMAAAIARQLLHALGSPVQREIDEPQGDNEEEKLWITI